MRPKSFMPAVTEISPGEAGAIPGLEAMVAYWTEEECSAEDWLSEVREAWGPAAFAMRRSGETLGYILYGPPGRLPRAGRYPVGPLSEDGALLAYVDGDARVRRHLLVRMLRDLRGRSIERVEAVTSDLGMPRHIPTAVLLESGWRPERRGWRRGSPYTLAYTELGSAVEVGELARGFIRSVKFPHLKKSPTPSPGAFNRATYYWEPVKNPPVEAGSRS